jgi:hypothetical protein
MENSQTRLRELLAQARQARSRSSTDVVFHISGPIPPVCVTDQVCMHPVISRASSRLPTPMI